MRSLEIILTYVAEGFKEGTQTTEIERLVYSTHGVEETEYACAKKQNSYLTLVHTKIKSNFMTVDLAMISYDTKSTGNKRKNR